MATELPGIATPSAVLEAAALAAPPVPTPAAADELRTLWPTLTKIIHRVYQDGRASDDDRVSFRAKADRSAALALVFLGPPSSFSSVGHVFATSVLPELVLDEALSLSLEDYRHLDETLDDVQHLLDARLPKAEAAPSGPVLPRPIAQAPAAEAPPAARRSRGLSAFEAAAAILSVAALAAVIVFFPEIKDFALRLQSRPAPKNGDGDGGEPGTYNVIRPTPEPTPKVTTKRRVRPRPPKATTETPLVQIPEFPPPEQPPKPATSTPVPPEKEPPLPPEKQPPEKQPPEKEPPEKEPPVEPPSPWAKLGAGAHRLFNGTDLKDWAQAGAWEVRGGSILGRSPKQAVASAIAGNPEWRDYAVQARARILRADRMTREDEYYLVIVRYQDAANFFCVRFPIEGIYEIGYYRDGRFHEVGRARHGLGSRFNQWHEVEITVKGNQLFVVIDNIRTGAPPWKIQGIERGAVGVGVTGGEAAFEDIRVRVEK